MTTRFDSLKVGDKVAFVLYDLDRGSFLYSRMPADLPKGTPRVGVVVRRTPTQVLCVEADTVHDVERRFTLRNGRSVGLHGTLVQASPEQIASYEAARQKRREWHKACKTIEQLHMSIEKGQLPASVTVALAQACRDIIAAHTAKEATTA